MMVISEIVDELLKKSKVTAAPIPVDDIIVHEGINLLFRELPDDISGILDMRSAPTILVNQSHHTNRQRFSMAHELGHYMLHGQKSIHVDKRTFFRDTRSSHGLEPEEIDANRFAAALLAPKTLVLKEIESVVDWIDSDKDVLSELARKFEISTTAMGFRLQNLSIIFSE